MFFVCNVSTVCGVRGIMMHEDITDLENLILSASAGVCYDSAIFEIVCEEAEAYFAGDMTEDTVLNTIQKRALTVMKER